MGVLVAPAVAAARARPRALLLRALCLVALARAGGAAEVTLEDGLRYEDLHDGSGLEARPGDGVSLTYSLSFLNHTSGAWVEVDAGGVATATIDFTLGSNTIVSGLNEGVVGMRAGGRRRIVVPPDLGYGSYKVKGLPREATLLYVVELVSVTPAAGAQEHGDGVDYVDYVEWDAGDHEWEPGGASPDDGDYRHGGSTREPVVLVKEVVRRNRVYEAGAWMLFALAVLACTAAGVFLYVRRVRTVRRYIQLATQHDDEIQLADI